MKLLLDENLSPLHTRALRELGHDAVSVVECGLSGADDSVVRAFAIENARILVTLDADFANVLRYSPPSSPGVIRLRIHPATEGAIDALLRSTILRLAGMSLDGKLVVADRREFGFGAEAELSLPVRSCSATSVWTPRADRAARLNPTEALRYE